MTEWSNVPVLKAGVPSVPRVRIPLRPAGMAKLVDARGLGPRLFWGLGSSPNLGNSMSVSS